MISSGLLKIICVGWVGGAILIGLLINGDRLYAWVGRKFTNEAEWMLAKLDIMFIRVEPKRLRTFYAAYLIFLFALGFFLLPSAGSGAVFGVLIVLVGWKMPRRIINVLFRRRVTRFVVQMVDGLGLMSNGLRSGLNVNQALSLVTEEMPNPISQEFNLVLSQNKLGVTMEEALSNLSIRMPHDDIEMFTTSINILKETGGNLAETFDK
ncbi:MAG: type II secretion system F family protein, partial [Bdellovibrionales bacterium]|nr:type II secretion system F family protein [Bdellovibrionales bacterium]